MNRDDAMKQSEAALKDLAKALSEGRSATLVKYLDTLSRFHRYSFGNCMLIAIQKPDASLVAGFHHWRKTGRWVKKGERGITILAPMISRCKGDDDAAESKVEGENRPRALWGFRAVHVFDISQTDGKELPNFAVVRGDPGEKLARLEDVIRRKGIELIYSPIPGGALGISEDGKVTVLPTLTQAKTFATLVHELAHELLHKGDRRRETTKTVRETEAEAVSYVVCKAAGLDCSTMSSDYIQLYAGSAETLMQSLELIRDVATDIITELEKKVSEEVQDVA